MRVQRDVAKTRYSKKSDNSGDDDDLTSDEEDEKIGPAPTIHSNRRYLDDYKVP